MKLLGSATTGVALFASSIALFAQRAAVSRFVIGTVASRNIIVPAPVAAVIFAVQYKQGQREMASAVPFSSVLSIATLGAFIALA